MAKTKVAKTEAPVMSKPTLFIDSGKVKGEFKVGRVSSVVVTGKVVEETLRAYETDEKRKGWRMEIDEIKKVDSSESIKDNAKSHYGRVNP